jgi:hypothetical protein
MPLFGSAAREARRTRNAVRARGARGDDADGRIRGWWWKATGGNAGLMVAGDGRRGEAPSMLPGKKQRRRRSGQGIIFSQ